MDDVASCLLGDLGCDGFPLVFVCEVFDLDEFVVVEGFVDVGDGGLGDAVFADLDSGFEAVGLFLEVACLSGCEWVHGGWGVVRFLNWFLFAVGCGFFFLCWVCLVWGCLGGLLVVWRVFLVCLGVVLLLNSY